MKKNLAIAIFCWLVLLVAPLIGQGKIASITPELPKWGDTIRVTYNPHAEGAAFFPGDDVYAIFHFRLENGVDQDWIEMTKADGLFVCEMPLEEGMAYLDIYFITLEKWDNKALLSAMISRENGIPARGANQHKMVSSSPDEYMDYFRKERELYPDNFAVFRAKLFIQGAFDKANLLSSVEKDMVDLEKHLSEPSDELLYSLSYGYLLLDREAEARKMLRILLDRYPQSYYTGSAISNYDYQAFSKGIQGEGPEEVKKMKKKLLAENPLTRFAREQALNFVGDKDVSLDVIRSVCDPWMEEEPDNPLPYYILAEAYSEKTGEYQKALLLLDKAIALLLRGKFRFHNDVSGFRTQRYLPQWHKKRAEIHIRIGDASRALADIKAAQAFEMEARPEYFETEGNIWQKLGLYDRAQGAWLEALELGSQEAENYLQKIYLERHESMEGFETYLSQALEKQKGTGSGEIEMAPDFDVTTLEGESLKLSDLKGKVVVLNFWFVGCAPCRVEMPGLNTLTDEFKDEDVIFIAFALDGPDALKEFLKVKQFEYRIVPKSEKICAEYGVKIFPTHIIINKSGQVEFTLTGGSEDRHEQLRPLIENLLR
jgi:peroxiredoxin/tetratricopeptide (TPR) repeat protein